MASEPRRLKLLFAGLILGSAGTWLAGNYQIVRTVHGVQLVERERIGWSDLLVDVRRWSPQDWQRHPDLARALLVPTTLTPQPGSARPLVPAVPPVIHWRPAPPTDSRPPSPARAIVNDVPKATRTR